MSKMTKILRHVINIKTLKKLDGEGFELTTFMLWGQSEKIARFEKLENLSNVFQNSLAFLGQFPEIYVSADRSLTQ